MNRLRTAGLSRDVVWHGRSGDLPRLVECALTHCSCEPIVGPNGVSRNVCGSHQILDDQHTLDHLAFARSVQHRLIDEEWRTAGAPTSRLDAAEWASILAVPTPVRLPHTSRRWEKLARLIRTPFAISLFALMLALGVPASSDPTAPPGVPIASWQTR